MKAYWLWLFIPFPGFSVAAMSGVFSHRSLAASDRWSRLLPRCPFWSWGDADQGTLVPGRIIRPPRLRPWPTATELNGALRARLAQKRRRPWRSANFVICT